MKPSSPGPMRPPPSRAQARNAALLNLAATPGLGSLMAGRRLAGAGQLLLAVAGFGMIMGWFVQLLLGLYKLTADLGSGPTNAPQTSGSLGWAGAAVFAAAWLWSAVTSWQLFRAVPKNLPRIEPPRLS